MWAELQARIDRVRIKSRGRKKRFNRLLREVRQSTGALSDARAIEAELEPIYIRTMPESDAWGRPFLYWSDTSFYYIVSTGADGLLDMEYPTRMPAELGVGATTEPAADIVFANGQFVQWPEGTQQ